MLRVIYNSQTYWAVGIYNAVSAGEPGILVGVRLFLGGNNGFSDPIPVADVTVIGGGGSGGGLDAEAAQDMIAAFLQAGAGIALTYNDVANTLTITATGGGTVTNEEIDDRVAALLQAGTNITLTYDDTANTLTIDAASGGGGVTLEEVQDNLGTSFLQAGTGIQLVYNDGANTLTIANTAPYSDEAVDDRVSSLLVAGSGIGLTYSDVANTLTIANTAGGLTLEDVQDNLGTSFLQAGNGIDLTYNDGANTLTVSNEIYVSSTPPVTPAANPVWLQTGTGITWIWTGSRWLSPPYFWNTDNNNLSAGTFRHFRTQEIWLESLEIVSVVSTTNNGGNYWTFDLQSFDAAGSASTIATLNTAANTAGQWSLNTVGIGSVFTPGTLRGLRLRTTATGTPGSYSFSSRLLYNLTLI